MLEAAGVPFEIAPALIDEEALKSSLATKSAAELAEALAEAKAHSVGVGADDLVLGSDQTLERPDGSILHKAGSRSEMADQLRSLAGRAHQLHSSAVVTERGQSVWSATETVTLHMRAVSDAFLSDYLDRQFDAVRWSVGGYHFEGMGAQLFNRVEGSHFAILGLPLLPLLAFLRDRGILKS